jgi:hypothetical protein
LSDFGVPDDEMPASQSRSDGSGPYDGSDLDGLLSGGNGFVPEGLRPVAQTLDALRVAPMPAELADEAAARSAFRQIMRSEETAPAWSAGSVSGADDPRTRVLPTGPAEARPRPAAGRHRRQRPPRRARWQVKALAGAGAVAVVAVGAVALASNLSGPGGHPSQAGASPGTAVTTAKASVPGSRVEGTGAQVPTPTPTPTATSQPGGGAGNQAAELCSQYLAFFRNPESASDWAAEQQRGQQLSTLAHGPANIASYCMHVLEPWAVPPAPGNAQDAPGPGAPPFGGSQGAPGSQDPNRPPGHTGIGNSGNSGIGQARNSPGFGGRNQR